MEDSQDVTLQPCQTASYTGGRVCLSGQNRVPEDATTPTGGNHTTLAVVANTPCRQSNANCTNASLEISSGRRTFYFITAVVTSLNSTHPTLDARAIHAAALSQASLLLQEHTAAWAERWQRGSIRVEGDLRMAQAANASLYVLRSSIRDDWPWGLSPGGLTTNGYNGHTFWDQETWMWPPLLLLDPPSAASALAYRFNRREGAAVKAETCGEPNHAYCPPDHHPSEGSLMFPWESAFTGHEVQFSGGKIGPWGEYEQHISGDVSFAARQYFYTTRDIEWLKRVGFPLIRGVASLYAARVESDGQGGYAFNQVMGPDEYAFPVNQSAYTNTVAAIALAAAAEFAPLVNKTVPADWALKARGLQAAIAPVPAGSGLKGDYHPEYAGYPTHGAKVKQADAVMLGFPFGASMSPETLANDLTWYEPHTDPNGPAMTWAIFAIGWISTGNYTHAQSRFQRGFDPNVQRPFNVWTETISGGCTPFLTGAGGFLQSLVFGTSGMRIEANRLTFNPAPPGATGGRPSATGLSVVNFHYLGSTLTQRIGHDDTVSYEVTGAPGGPLAPQLVLTGVDMETGLGRVLSLASSASQVAYWVDPKVSLSLITMRCQRPRCGV